MNFSTDFTSRIPRSGVPEVILELAQALMQRHGDVLVSREKNGLHLNLACPACLGKEGRDELTKRHLAVNAEKYFGLGKKWGTGNTTRQAFTRERVGKCMKCNRVYEMQELLDWPTLAERNIQDSSRGRVSTTDGSLWLVPWIPPQGLPPGMPPIMVPGGPGDGSWDALVPVNHPQCPDVARQYLYGRGFETQEDFDELYAQMRVSFCVREWAADAGQGGRKYRRLPGGFQDSPQGRIIFFCDIGGIPRGWQGRIIEHQVEVQGGTRHWFYNGQSHQWACVFDKSPQGTVFHHGFNNPDFKWNPSKYRTANGTSKNEVIFGVDAALEWNRQFRAGLAPLGFLTEGPLDAGCLGRPAMAAIGKYISDEQARLLGSLFATIILIPDNDTAGEESLEDNVKTLSKHVKVILWRLPTVLDGKKIKDMGDVPRKTALAMKNQWLAQNQ